jgi:hypothetical protein
MTNDEKDERMKELEAEVKALAAWRKKIEEQQSQPPRNTPIGSPLEGVLGPTAQLAIDRATRPKVEVDQLDLVGLVGKDGRR